MRSHPQVRASARAGTLLGGLLKGLPWSATALLLLAGGVGCGPGPVGERPPTAQEPGPLPPPAQPVTPTQPTVPVPPVLPAQPPGPAEPTGPRALALPPLQKAVRQYRLELAPADLERLLANPQANVEVPGAFFIGERRHAARVSLRGKYARTFPKKSFKVELVEGEFEERTRFHLVAEYMDATLMAEKLAMDLFLAAGVPAPRTWFAELTVNGQHQGLYVDFEHVGNRFATRHGWRGEGFRQYRCGQHDCELKDTPALHWQGGWEEKTDDSPFEDQEVRDPSRLPPLHALLEALNQTPPQGFAAELEERLDLEEFLRFLAMDAIVSNDTEEDSRSHLVRSARDGRWHYVPWDLNNGRMMYNRRASPNHVNAGDRPLWSFTAYDPVVQERMVERAFFEGFRPTWSTLYTRVYEDDGLRARLLDELERQLDAVFDGGLFAARVEEVHRLVADAVARDPHVPQDYAARTRVHYGHYARNREAFLRRRLAEERAALAAPRVRINEVSADGWLELHNGTEKPVDVGGLWVARDVRQPERQLPAGLVVPPKGHLRLTAAELGFSPADSTQVGLFRGRDGAAPLEVLFYGALPGTAGRSLGRSPDGAAGWKVLPATPGGANGR
jgi:spore coat protein H